LSRLSDTWNMTIGYRETGLREARVMRSIFIWRPARGTWESGWWLSFCLKIVSQSAW